MRTVRFWAMGREGEVVEQLVPEFERRNPGIRVDVQQIPWSAAHEKLLTAFVGDATPDVAQLGNTWVPEFQALNALEPLDARAAASSTVPRADYFAGIWDTNVIDGQTYGLPWYVDTRVLFYRPDLMAAAGYPAAADDVGAVAGRHAEDEGADGAQPAPHPAADQRVAAAGDPGDAERRHPAARRRPLRRLQQPGLPPRIRRSTSTFSARGWRRG